MKGALIFIFIIINCQLMWSQDEDPVKQNIIEQRIEIIAEQYEDEDVDFVTLFDELSYYYNKPLNLNSASEEELKSLFLFTDRQVLELLSYRNRYRQILTIYELQYIPTFDKATVDMILPFIIVAPKRANNATSLLERLKYGRSQLFIRYQRVLEEMQGYSDISDSALALNPNRRYLGSPDRVYLRYRYQFRNSFSFGITADKDAGEEFFNGTQSQGFDFYSMHLYAKNIGKLKKIALGDYQVQFGQGLALWSGLAFGKSPIVRNLKRNATGIKPYSSVDENLFLRGAAATFGLGKFELTAFGSYKNIDGNIAAVLDTSTLVEETIFTSFQQTGYHRTPAELEDKRSVSELLTGTHLSYKTDRMHIGMSGLYSKYGSELNRSTQIYNQFEFQGRENINASLDYNFFAGGVNIFGESAISQSGGMAHLIGVMTELDSKVRFVGMLRSYDKDYQALLANGFGEGSRTNNEIGTIFGVETKINKRLNFQGYADFYKWKWLGYQRNAPGNGQDYLGQLNFKANRTTLLYARYKWESKPRNNKITDGGISFPVPEVRQQLRLHVDKTLGNFKFRSRFEWIGFAPNDGIKEHGFMIYQDLVWRSLSKPISIATRYALFQTDSYDTRIYAYENDVLYAFSIPAYYNRGSRAYITLKYSPNSQMDLWLRWGQFFYNDVDQISSGLNQINGPTKTEVKAQVRFKF